MTWQAFSKFIRLRDSDDYGYCECISCGKIKYWENDGMQAGHLIPTRCNNILFDEELVHAQCAECNNNSGEQKKFWDGLKERYGYEEWRFDEFKFRKNIYRKDFKQWELEDIEDKYLDKCVGLAMGKQLNGN